MGSKNAEGTAQESQVHRVWREAELNAFRRWKAVQYCQSRLQYAIIEIM